MQYIRFINTDVQIRFPQVPVSIDFASMRNHVVTHSTQCSRHLKMLVSASDEVLRVI